MTVPQTSYQAETLEQGDIFFLYRPAVEDSEVDRLREIHRFHLLLHPMGWQNHRLITIGKKRLPKAMPSGERYWGFVEEIVRTDWQLADHFAAADAGKSNIHCLLLSMWTVGMGEYRLLRYGDHTQLVYELMLAEQASELQRVFRIACSARYIIHLKNPNIPTRESNSLEYAEQVQLPKQLQENFKGRRYLNADPPELLNYEGMELLLVRADESLQTRGMDFNAQRADVEREAESIFNALGRVPTKNTPSKCSHFIPAPISCKITPD